MTDHEAGFDEELDEIAVIGMAARFPGAPNLEVFWEKLCAGETLTRELTEAELARLSPEVRNAPNYVPYGGFLDDVDQFDASFFGMIPREAQITDPQQRLFLEICWEALERAGINPATDGGRLGLFAGCGTELYLRELLGDPEVARSVDAMQLKIGNTKDHLAPRTSYLFNLRGPSVPVQTACSTSLVAVHLACQSLITYQSDMVLAGGVRIITPHYRGYTHVPDSILSPDGRCRAFDARAAGTVPSSGVGVVLLKRLEDALEDGDHIHAVIRGSAINNDGALKLGYTAPSVEGQTAVIREALSVAMVAPEEIGYLEAHGTGTALGDPVEVTALTRAWRTEARGTCALGALKSNLGHMDAAAGIAGLIKAVLCIENRTLVPTCHYEEANPQIDFEATPFFVNTETRAWDAARRIAGVSAFGIGGTNAHVILAEAPEPEPRSPETRSGEVLTLSAKSENALRTRHRQLIDWLERHPEASLGDVAHTLAVGRQSMRFRRAFGFADREELLTRLAEEGEIGDVRNEGAKIVFMFPGQGTAYADLGREWYETVPVFAETVDRCCAHLKAHHGLELGPVLFAEDDDRVYRPRYWQPALFVVEYAMAKTWMDWGLFPETMIGHSIGEIVAAVIAEVIDWQTGLDLVAHRGAATERVDPGAMVAVMTSREQVSLEDPLALAAVNGPELCVVSGPPDTIDAFIENLTADGIRHKRLKATHAFHSPMMAPVAAELDQIMAEVTMQAPKVPMITTATGTWWQARETNHRQHWGRHLQDPVLFADGLENLMAQPDRVFLEVGPGRVLANLVRNHPKGEGFRVIDAGSRPDVRALMNAVAALWRAGATVDWKAFTAGRDARRLVLPTYPFARESHWHGATGDSVIAPPSGVHGGDAETRLPMADWLYLPSWREAPAPGVPTHEKQRWLVFGDDALAQGLVARLRAEEAEVIQVASGQDFEKTEQGYAVEMTPARDYIRLVDALVDSDRVPDRIVVIASAGTAEIMPQNDSAVDLVDVATARYLMNPLLMLRQFGDRLGDPTLRLEVVTRGLNGLPGSSSGHPLQALFIGLVASAPSEFENTTSRIIDLAEDSPEDLFRELARPIEAPLVCLYDRSRWVRDYRRVAIPEAGPAFRDNGCYLLINGWQEIGRFLAQSLFLEHNARVAIVDRALFPTDRAAQDAWLAEEGPDDLVSERIAWARELQALGADLHVFSVDPADPRALEAVCRELGAVDGALWFDPALNRRPIMHYEPGETLLPVKTALREALSLFETRDHLGTVVLFGENLGEGFVGMSVQHGLYGMLGALAEHWRRAGGSATMVAWGMRAWREPPRSAIEEIHQYFAKRYETSSVSYEEGLAALHRAVSSERARVIVSTCDLDAVLAQNRAQHMHFEKINKREKKAISGRPRPELETVFVAPRSDLEEDLVALWCHFFGYKTIGIHDNFFELGGHSLMATRVISRLREDHRVELSVDTLFAKPTIAELADEISRADKAEERPSLPPITAGRHEGPLPLSFAQQRLWFLHQLLEHEHARAAYNIVVPYEIEGELSPSFLEAAFAEIVRRHDSLRTAFLLDAQNEPYQMILPFTGFDLPFFDLRHLPEAERAVAAKRILDAQAKRDFDLTTGRPFRFCLVHLAPNRFELVINIHHTVGDGWSIGVVINEVSTLYRAFSLGRPSPLPALPIQYTDYTFWQRSWEDGPYMSAHMDYWSHQLADAPTITSLPTDFPRQPTPGFHGMETRFVIPPEIARAMAQLARETDTTLFMVIQMVMTALFMRYTGQDDIVLGSPIANRNYRETEPLIGFFVNTLVLRTDLSGDPSAVELAARVRRTALASFAHQDVPFEYVVEKLQPERNLTQSPLFQVMFALQNTPTQAEVNPTLLIRPKRRDRVAATFDMTWNFYQRGEEGMVVVIELDTDLYLEETVQRFGRHFNTLGAAMAAFPERPISTHALVVAAERQRLVNDWNQTTEQVPAPVLIRFEEIATRNPDRVAIRAHGEADDAVTETDYSELLQRSRVVAAHLSEHGIGPESIVAVIGRRDADLVAALLGTLAVGAAFLPLDPTHPPERLASMLEDSGVAHVLTTGMTDSFAVTLPRFEVSELKASPVAQSAIRADDQAAYLIYTSGSTGRPKGVVVPHRGLDHIVAFFVPLMELGPEHHVLQFAALTFDAMIVEIFPTLCSAATLVMAPRERLQPGMGLDDLLAEEPISCAILPPSVLSLVARELPALSHLMVAGEACPAELAQRWATGRSFFNGYGPTENSVGATSYRCRGDERVPPIGAPLSHVRSYVVDRHLAPLPVGIPGELVVGGAGLTRGYLGRPATTAAVFVPDPFGTEPGSRLYRTGDLVRHAREDRCELVFMGRIDHQVKLRGFRIELGEIEAALTATERVVDAVVLLRRDLPSGAGLVAFVQRDEGAGVPEKTKSELIRSLATRLPAYMVPNHFLFLPRLPLTPNNKIDRKALGRMPVTAQSPGGGKRAPETETECALAEIWRDLLKVDEIGADDNFFQLGGHSLLITRMVLRIQEVHGVTLELKRLFLLPTLAELAAYLDDVITARALQKSQDDEEDDREDFEI